VVAGTLHGFFILRGFMKDLQLFNFQGSNEIRVVNSENGDIWFVAKDVCTILELNDVSKACSRLDDDEKGTTTILTLGGEQVMSIINESGLYSLVLTSRKPEAKAFKKWITAEVLPSIRKTGSYSVETKPLSQLEILAQSALALVDMDRRQTALESEVKTLAAKIEKSPADYFTVAGFASLRGFKLGNSDANKGGRIASKLSREHGYPINKAHSEIFGEVNTYHVDILTELFDEYKAD